MLCVVVLVIVYFLAERDLSQFPVIYMTTHNYSNIIAFNGNDGKLLTHSFLDMSNFSHLIKKGDVRMRGIMLENNHFLVVNAHHKHSFIAKFLCCNLIKNDNNSNPTDYEICKKHSKKTKNSPFGIPFQSILTQVKSINS